MLESLSFGYNIVTVDEETRLCDKDQVPSDPCESMYVVVEGSLGLVTTSEGSATYKVEIGVSRGAVVGEQDALLEGDRAPVKITNTLELVHQAKHLPYPVID